MPVSAADQAARLVERVRDDPHARLALCADIYRQPAGGAQRRLPFRRAAISFMRWQLDRGVLASMESEVPGSAWWRAVNERLLHDGCEAIAHSQGLCGARSVPSVELWVDFVDRPTPRSWYRAHNASIVAAYLEHRALADSESAAERFFLNVVLLRVLYAHALVAAPRLSLGWFSVLGRPLGDPRLGMAGAFLSLSRILPARYPALDGVSTYVDAENNLGRMLDYGVILPRLPALYEWSAEELAQPALAALVQEGAPCYAAPFGTDAVWNLPEPPLPISVLRLATRPRARD
ncbi:MAG TPA: hypothetical protein VHT29_14865 [Solirubrobacteraceae bacterium]|jgi:hypothetical protein|nr:hypothetical protein [Solirubrobacteraceae bacterium]